MSDHNRTAFLLANEGVEQVELTEALLAFGPAGAQVDLLAPEHTTFESVEVRRKVDAERRADVKEVR